MQTKKNNKTQETDKVQHSKQEEDIFSWKPLKKKTMKDG